MNNILQKSSFEKNFIERTYSSIVSDISIAFSELVANSWDAGATQVNITLPNKDSDEIVIEDNGSGMTDEDFNQRWMVIAYNRVAHQGDYIEYSSTQGKIKRLAYGRNGVGRHALLCFDDSYTVETWKNGICNRYIISVDGGDSAFSVLNHTHEEREGSGTKLIVKALKNFPTQELVVNTLGYRFLFDPEFTVCVNGKAIEFHKNVSPIKEKKITLNYGHSIEIKIYQIPDGEKNIAENGIAFWSNKRLVGNPSWYVGNTRVEDARRKFALKHLIVVQADCLIGDIQYDWSGFKNTQPVLDIYKVVISFVREYRNEYYKGKVTEVKKDIIKKNVNRIEKLSIPALYDLKVFLTTILNKNQK